MAIQMALLGRRERERESRRSSSSKKKVRLLCLKNETKMDKARKKKKFCVSIFIAMLLETLRIEQASVLNHIPLHEREVYKLRSMCISAPKPLFLNWIRSK